ncbi:MAG: molybdopterin molybdotransferase MoeA, partial [bacterium]|nr:molybdopterin molybdotransferase MoeA [bacterium]
MKEFFKVTDLDLVRSYASDFPRVATEKIPLIEALGRILAADIVSDVDLPDFVRATMDGYAVSASSTFGATEANPAYLTVTGTVLMGDAPAFSIGPGEAARISTGGMLPPDSDSVVMVEHSETLDDTTIEVYRSVAPGHNVVQIGEDIKKTELLLPRGVRFRPQETGLLAAFGIETIDVYKKPVIGIISTGDEIVPINETPGPGFIRDINTYTLSHLVQEIGGIPVNYGIVKDEYDDLYQKCIQA